ncbi:pyridine nucleotide-disulfide oxidoreductase [Deinococcus aetherius]|uniref:Pyridine nucleotide-disulfide oxidoreductase n=1 Tax=Deinococcus aetherius TaxID=200252 RepID=A0ABM8AF08_9DEIO|nr:NAD(P)/FAD-dependent oxidoreductase [Deinococcus aetherius]BDP42389.1 pyridine nucleotide-disulfide oxidoreductase [Deinococcus aetherius]
MKTSYDVIVVGASNAGLSAALVLGRACRSVLVLDGGPPRNAPADAAHGFLTRDGTLPAELLRIAREQLIPYGVEVRPVAAAGARALPEGFQVELAGGELVEARRLLLASGVRDLLPEVPGLRERWGQSVHHCPYCHGWEVRDEPIAVYGRGDMAFHQAVLLHHWSPDLVLLTGGPAEMTADQRHQLSALGIEVIESAVERLEGPGPQLQRVVFQGGGSLARSALFVGPRQEQRSTLPTELGCACTEDGVYVNTQPGGQTSVPGVYAAGDMTGPLQQVAQAVAGGALAAATLNNELIFADARRQAVATGR